MSGSEHNIERCLVCGLLLASDGQCSVCDGASIEESATISDLAKVENASKKDVSDKNAASSEIDFQSTNSAKNKYSAKPAYLFNKKTKECFELTQAASRIGRDQSNDIFIDDQHISRYHAWILNNKDEFWVEDLGSANGTLLNGKLITVRMQLAPGDKLVFGKTEFVFVID